MFVDIGASRDAIVPHDDLSQLDEKWLEQVTAGDQVPVRIMHTPGETGELVVSIEKGLAVRDWQKAERCLAEDELVKLKVVGHNKGGLLVEFGFLTGFIPNSHVPDCRYLRDARLLNERKANKVGQTISAKVLEIDMRKERLVLSATAAAAELEDQRLENLEEGKVVKGRVVNLVTFGAFVDIGGVQGLVHISNITWEKIEHPSEALSVGEEIDVLIEKVDLDRKRINLNRKVALPNPWQQVTEKYDVGDLVEGEVTNTTDFGIFVALPIGVEGLVHESEILDYQRDALKAGDEILVRIIRIQADQGRIGLSLKEVTLDEELEWMAQRRRDDQDDTLAEHDEEE